MKKYYLHNGTESSGPFDIEELKAKNITTKTPVWFEGMERWKTAGEIEELLSIFISIPPIDSISLKPPTTPNKLESIVKERTILGLSTTTFSIVAIILIMAIGIIVINTLRENKRRELELKNHKTEIDNYQLELQQKELEEQKIQMVIQEKIDSERVVRERKQNLTNRLSEIDKILSENQDNLNTTEKKLKDASGFKLLRSSADKKDQMDLLQKNIDSITNAIHQLKLESNQLKLELEKIK